MSEANVRCAHIQMSCPPFEEHLLTGNLAAIKQAMIDKHLPFIDEAGEKKVNILCLQELFFAPYFCVEKDLRWFVLAEEIPEGQTTKLLSEYAKKYHMVIIAPMFEHDAGESKYYNTTAVIDADGTYLGKMRKVHIPDLPGFREEYYFSPSDVPPSVFKTQYATIGVYTCYDRHYSYIAMMLALMQAQILFNPCAASLQQSGELLDVETPFHATANKIFIGVNNRVGREGLSPPWSENLYYGSSYFVDPLGSKVPLSETGIPRIMASRDKDELVIADLELKRIAEARSKWPGFFQKIRPDMLEVSAELAKEVHRMGLGE